MGKRLATLFVAINATIHPVYAAFVEIALPIISEQGRIAGFTTVDPSLAYMVPQSWEIYRNNIYQSTTGFSFVLAPVYDTVTLAKYKITNPGKSLVPIPHKLNEARLFLGELLSEATLLGKIKYQVSPDNLSNQSDIVYFNVDVSSDTQDFFKEILTSNTGITGYVELSYPFQSRNIDSQIPMRAQTKSIAHILPESYPVLWLERLSLENCLSLDAFLNVQISLGLQTINLQSIESNACWLPENIRISKLSAESYYLQTVRKGVSNLKVSARLLIKEIGLTIVGDAFFESDIILDLESITVTMPKFRVINFDDASQTVNHVYKNAIINQLNKNSRLIRDHIANTLTEELRTRIINGNIFL